MGGPDSFSSEFVLLLILLLLLLVLLLLLLILLLFILLLLLLTVLLILLCHNFFSLIGLLGNHRSTEKHTFLSVYCAFNQIRVSQEKSFPC